MTCICPVCKTPVEPALGIKVNDHVVHSGYCAEIASQNHLNESDAEEQEQLVESTMLLL